MKKLFKFLRYIFINGLFSYFLYVGIVYNQIGLKNIGFFMVWFTILMSFILFVNKKNKKIKEVLKEHFENHPIPEIVDQIFDVIVSFFLIYHGYFVVGSLYFLHLFALKVIREEALK